MAWEDFAEEADAPLFQSLGHERVVRISKRAAHDSPSLRPQELFFVDQEAHELHDTDGRVGVVELDRHFVREGLPVGVVFFEAADDVAQRAGDEEVLLDEAKFLAGFGVVVRVKHLTDGLSHVFLLHGLLVAASIESIEIKLLGGFGFP